MAPRPSPNQRSSAEQSLQEALDLLGPRLEKAEAIVAGTRERIQQFVRNANDDLVDLIVRGADPNIILHIVSMGTLYPNRGEQGREKEREHRRLGSKRYWQQLRRSLEQADECLRAFLDTETFIIWSQLYRPDKRRRPFDSICRRMDSTAKSVRQAIDVLSQLKLDEDGWEMQSGWDGPNLARTNKTGKRKSGAPKLYQGQELTLELCEYVKVTTGAPCLGPVCRILSHAGLTEFRDGSQRDKDVLTKRLARLRDDPLLTYAVAARLADYGVSPRPNPPWFAVRGAPRKKRPPPRKE